MNSAFVRRFAFRAWHQFRQEWRMQWLLVLLWVALLIAQWWHGLQRREWELPMPTALPGMLALLILVRSARADAPGNVEIGSHTRPLGRGAVWLGKVAFAVLALLVPWMLRKVPDGLHFGFGPVEWLAVLGGHVLPALMMGGVAAVCAAAGDSGRKAVFWGIAGFVLMLGLFLLENAMSLNDARRFAWVVVSVLFSVTMLLTWWRMSLRQRWLRVLICGGVVMGLVLAFWRVDWRAVPLKPFTEAKLALHVGERPDEAAQELWRGLFVTGLPPDHVVSVLELGDYSDFASSGPKKERKDRWMRQAHTRALLPHYPAGSLWHGQQDLESREYLKKITGEKPKSPMRLKLLVQRMERVISHPMKQRGQQSVLLGKGLRFEFRVNWLDRDQQTWFWARMPQFYPRLLPRMGMERLETVCGVVPRENFLMLLHSPALQEVRTAGEGDYAEEMDFAFTHPSPHMDLTGLTLKQWLDESTLDIWRSVECGVVDLEISAADLQRVY